MKYTVRPATGGDAQKLLDVYAPYIRETSVTFEYEVPSVADFSARIESVTARFPWLVCEADGETAGYVYAGPFHDRAAFQWDAEVSAYFRPEFQHKGLAAALYRCLYSLLKEQGYYKLYSLIAEPNPQSTAFHQRMGFTNAGVYRNTGYKLGAWHGIVVLEYALTPLPQNPEPPRTLHQLDPVFVEQRLFKAQDSLNRAR